VLVAIIPTSCATKKQSALAVEAWVMEVLLDSDTTPGMARAGLSTSGLDYPPSG
jgi:hypothetical protein